MAFNPHTEKLSNGKIRLWFTPDLSGQGYRFYRDGTAVTRTFDKNIDHMDFTPPDTNPHDYGVQLMTTVGPIESSKYPAPAPNPDPQPEGLWFDLPTLSSPMRLTVPMDVDFRLPSTTVGKDVILDFEGRQGKIRQYSLILDSTSGPPHALWLENIHTRCTKPHDVGGSGYRNGGIRIQTKAKVGVIKDMLDEKYHTDDPTGTDGIGIASGGDTDWYIANVWTQGAYKGHTPDGQHVDCIQLQGPISTMKIGMCSFDLSGIAPPNHPGKGLQLAEEPWITPGEPFKVEIDQVDYLCRGASGFVYGVAIVQEFATDLISLGENVWWVLPEAVRTAVGDNFGVTVYPNWGATGRGTVSGSRPNRVLGNFPPNSGLSGKLKERAEGSPRYVTRATLGM